MYDSVEYTVNKYGCEFWSTYSCNVFITHFSLIKEVLRCLSNNNVFKWVFFFFWYYVLFLVLRILFAFLNISWQNASMLFTKNTVKSFPYITIYFTSMNWQCGSGENDIPELAFLIMISVIGGFCLQGNYQTKCYMWWSLSHLFESFADSI